VQEGTALRHRYIGGVILEESGLYALGPRLYDPEVGRFLSPDPLVAYPMNPQAFNRYRNNGDPSAINEFERGYVFRDRFGEFKSRLQEALRY
jgi:RHS repeat-associated protein